jgi:hypothetical protein
LYFYELTKTGNIGVARLMQQTQKNYADDALAFFSRRRLG